MSDNPQKPEEQSPEKAKEKDSLGIPVEKSPWLVYALLQIPLVLIMVLILYFMYTQRD